MTTHFVRKCTYCGQLLDECPCDIPSKPIKLSICGQRECVAKAVADAPPADLGVPILAEMWSAGLLGVQKGWYLT